MLSASEALLSSTVLEWTGNGPDSPAEKRAWNRRQLEIGDQSRMRRLFAYAGSLILIAGPTQAAEPTGDWLVKDGSAHIRIDNCGGKLWGIVAWLAYFEPVRRVRPWLTNVSGCRAIARACAGGLRSLYSECKCCANQSKLHFCPSFQCTICL